MKNENIKYVPENIQKPTYTVSVFNEAEWNKGLTTQEIVQRNELTELEYQDWLLHGPQFGPGNSASRSRLAGEEGEEIAAAVLAFSYATPAGVITAPGSIAVTGFAMITKGVAQITENKKLEEASDKALAITLGGIAGGVEDCYKALKK